MDAAAAGVDYTGVVVAADIEAAAALALALLHRGGGKEMAVPMERAHADDVEDTLEDDVPCVPLDAGKNNAPPNTVTHAAAVITADGADAADEALAAATNHDHADSTLTAHAAHTAQRQAAASRTDHDLRIRRWSIVRQQAELVALRELWWERCGVSAAIRKGVQWTNLRVFWNRARPSQQREADMMSSPQLRSATEAALRRALSVVGVADRDVNALHCCTMKVLRSPPGAGRQRLHLDVPSAALIHHPRTRKETSERKAPRCISVILHLNPGVTRGTHVPLVSAEEMSSLVTLDPHDWPAGSSERLCAEDNFLSHDMHGGDALIMYGNVAHFGPANPSNTEWRWVLFTMFSPEAGPEQDASQEFFA